MARHMSSTLIQLLLLVAATVLVLLASTSKPAGARNVVFHPAHGRNSSTASSRGSCFVDSILAFGDSTTDTGNAVRAGNPGAQLAANPPYGMDFDDVHGWGRPSGRFSDGRLMLDYLSEALGLPLVPPHLARGVQSKNHSASSPGRSDNFAVAGATALEPSLLQKLANATSLTPYSLKDELKWLHEAVRHHRVSNNTLVYFGEIGGNDYNYAFAAHAGQQLHQQLRADIFKKLVPRVVEEIHTALKRILKAGVTHVIVQGDFPMGCMPVYLRQAKAAAATAPRYFKGLFDMHGCVAAVSAVSDEHNLRLRRVVHELQARHPHARLVFFDTTAAYLHILHHASAYGFTNTTEPCVNLGNLLSTSPSHPAANPAAAQARPTLSACPDPRKFMSWDGIHMTDAMYKAMVRLFLGLDHRAGVAFSSPPRNFLTAPAAACRATKPL